MTATKIKVAKKMFENLDRAEIRSLAIFGMKLSPATAYKLESKQLVSWVHDRALTVPDDEITGDRSVDTRPFADADLASMIATLKEREAFREGVLEYIKQLQEFVRGEAKQAPGWPPIKEDESGATPPEVKEAPPAKRKRGRPRKSESVNNKTLTKPKLVTAPEVVVKPTPKQKIKKTKLGTKSEPAVASNSQVEVLKETVHSLENRVVEMSQTLKDISAFTDGLANGIKDGFERMNEQVMALRAEQTAAHNLLGNALLFLMNSAIFEQGEEKIDLSGIPEPSTYLDTED